MFILSQKPIVSHLLQQVLLIVEGASEILRDEYTSYCAGDVFTIEHKGDTSPVTQADYRVNQYIIDQLKKVSDLPVLSEEGQKNEYHLWNKFWLLDPLDGTKEFLHQRPEFTINLSIIEHNTTIFAILAAPYEYTVYIAPENGKPLKYNYKKKEWFEFIESQKNLNSDVKVGLSQSSQKKSKYEEFLNTLIQFNAFESYKAGSAYKFCMMLEDKIDIYPRFHPTCEWDTSAGQCLLERIGGGLVDFKGRRFTYNQRDSLVNNGFIAFRNQQMKDLAFNVLELMSKKTQ